MGAMSGRLIDDGLRLLCLAMIVVVVCFLLVPIAVTVVMAFDARAYLGPLPPPGFSLRWFRQFFADDYFLRGLGTSLQLAAASVAVSLSVGVATAFAIDRARLPGYEAAVSLFLSPLTVPRVVTGFALLPVLAEMGLDNGFARLLARHIIITWPYSIRATRAGLAGSDRSLSEAALVLGATERQAFWDVTFPPARTGIVSSAI